MEQKELRKMDRMELIEIIYAMQQNEKVLKEQLKELQTKLDERIIKLESSGSIAEAALKLNDVFADAEEAVKQYKESVFRQVDAEAKEMREKTVRGCKEVIAELEEYIKLRVRTADLDTKDKVEAIKKVSGDISSLGGNNG